VLATRRLPGIRFEAAPPPPAVVLPRMDIGAFVGFASCGPLDVPVAVEDPARFAEVFGPDPELAWDQQRGEPAYGHLGPAVRSFFRNGGRRCHVVRVAAPSAAPAAFELPGLVVVDAAGKTGHALLAARSPGSWADGVRVGMALITASVPPLALWSGPSVPRQGDVAPGDVLRVRFPETGWTLVVAVRAADRDELAAGARLWLAPARPRVREGGAAQWLDAHGEPATAAARIEEAGAGTALVSLDTPPESAPQLGSQVCVELASMTLWLRVADVQGASSVGLARADRVAVRGPTVAVSSHAPRARALRGRAIVQRLELELAVALDEGPPRRLGGLGLAPGHPRFAGALPSDDRLYARLAGAEPVDGLWADAAEPRFPLAGAGDRPELLVPLSAQIVAATLPARVSAAPRWERDGLGRFSAALFVDPALSGRRTDVLLEEANFIRFRSPQPQPLKGMHALLGVAEATLVAVPDAVQRGWSAPGAEAPAAIAPQERALAAPSEEPLFVACVPLTLEPPTHAETFGPVGGAVTVRWDAVEHALEYELQEALDSTLATAVTVHRGPETSVQLFGRPEGGARYYRVRALAGDAASDWAYARAWAAAPTRALLDAPAGEAPELQAVQRDLLRMCAARGDMFALLALPEHFREVTAIAHVRSLAAGDFEPSALGFGAFHHPWLVEPLDQSATVFRRLPPDGAAAGVAAAVATRQGAWVAPANEPLRDVVALATQLPEAARAPLQDAQINLVRQEPAGFLWLAADTLAADPDVRPINVRRLIQLIRRLAVRHGATYVFEPNDAVLARTVERGFDAIMTILLLRGAFAGMTPAQSYRVDTGSPPNSPTGVDQGRFVVELRFAPSRPLAFLTVRLVRTGDGAVLVEEA
jgi:hypothetical protein